jgi:DNA repair photolyase
MVRVIHAKRKSAILTSSSLACLSHTPTINLTMGCAHGCLYCYTRGYRVYPGEGIVNIYDNAIESLRHELAQRKQKPAVIYFSPASDLFQPLSEVLNMGYCLLQEILSRGIGVAFLTKGVIPERHMSLLRENASLVRAQIGLIALDDTVLRTFEPNAAPAAVRLAQMKQLTEIGINTQLRIDPILPELTDDEQTFRQLCRNTKDAGVTTIAASVLFLRPVLARRLQQASQNNSYVLRCLGAFSHAQRIAIHADRSSVIALPMQKRQQIFERLEFIAGQYGMTIRRCACKNPDIDSGTCSIAGNWQRPISTTKTTLFDESKEIV